MTRADQPQPSPAQVQAPQVKTEPLARNVPVTPAQSSPRAPAKQTPTKSSIKALPTVRDHTSDQLGPDNDEYIPREFDEAGEKKVDELGYPQGGRQFKCRTFTVPERGQKLFMLATECARVLNYRDSYLLFNKNRSLYKIIATQPEKDHLITQDILPYSYRSRQIAIVTAKSMFRQFGSRVIVNGRRVRDDYWEGKARKQGFTEDDLAGEKRPGGAKSREAAAAESQLHALPTFAQGDIVYSNGPVFDVMHPQQLPAGLAATLGPSLMNIVTSKDYSNIPRPRQEISGAPYQDRSQPSSATEIMNQAAQTAEFNKSLNRSRGFRSKGLEDHWNKPREPAILTPQSQAAEPVAGSTVASQPYTSPRFGGSDIISTHPPNLLPQQQSHHPTPPHMNASSYTLPQNPSQSPIHRQNSMQASMRDPSQYQPQQNLHRSSSSASLGHGQQTPSHQQSPYGYPSSSHQQQIWGGPPPQPQASPVLNRMHTSQYSPSLQSQQAQQMPSPVQSHHASQSPHPPQQIHPSQMLHQQSGTSNLSSQHMYGGGLPAMQGSQPGYPVIGAGRQMYPGGQNQQQYMPQQSQQSQHGGMQGWPAVTQGQQGGWSTY